MQMNGSARWLIVALLLLSTCLLTTHCKGGRGGGGRGGGGRGGGRGSSSGRPSSSGGGRGTDYGRGRESSSGGSPSYPAPAPAPPPAPKPPAPKPPSRPAAPSPRPSVPDVPRQPASNPNFKETNPVQSQPAYNPNYKPPGGPPPPYAPGGQQAPSAPVGPPPPYSPGQSGGYGQPPPYPVQPPPYPGPAVRPPSYPGLPNQNSPYPVQPGQNRPYPVQPGSQPGQNRPYPVQPGSYPGQSQPYPVQPGSYPGQSRPYPVQPGSYPGQNRPYPVQPGSYQGSYPGGYRPGGHAPYPQQPLGSNVWHPQSNVPPPPYMNYGGLPTGSNMQSKPYKKKGFLGSLMSMGKPKKDKSYKYHGSYPSPYGIGRGGGGIGGLGGMHGGFGKSAAMYTILPYMVARKTPKLFKPRFGFMPFYMPHYHHHYYHHHNYHGYGGAMPSELAPYYDVYDMQYVGKCQRPIRSENIEIKCNTTFEDVTCRAKCKDGYEFAGNSSFVRANKCWHVTGVWRPAKNFPKCEPVCEDDCQNGGVCKSPNRCSCPPEYRGDRCQFHFLKCDIRTIAQDKDLGWVCSHGKNETTCRVRCKEPAQFEVPPAETYTCSLDGKWTPDAIPKCTRKEEEAKST